MTGPSLRLCGAVAAAMILSSYGHAADPLEQEPRHVTDPALREEMRALSHRMLDIAYTSLDDRLAPDEQRDEVVALLDEIESIGQAMFDDESSSNWSQFDRYMGSLLYDVVLARRFASADPPDLVPALLLVRSCDACHGALPDSRQ